MPAAPFDFSPLRESNALVTGAGGFVGAHLCRMLRGHGAAVHALHRRARPDQPDRQWIADAADMGALREVFGEVRPDYVFHLASHVSGSRELSAVAPTFRDNLATTVNLLTLATESGCKRFVLAGSLEEAATGSVAETVPASPYAAAKLGSTLYARMFHALYGTPVVAARIFMVYGPGQRDLEKLVPYVTVSLLSGRSPRLGPGTRPVDWVFVDDVAEGLVRAALAPSVVGKSVDLGTGETVLVRTVAERLATIIGGGAAPLFGALPDRPMEQVRVADTAATEAALGFAPRTALDEGLRRTVAWYRDKLRTKEIDPAGL
jgi:nucleoside-diphosphate-sugar epimerase